MLLLIVAAGCMGQPKAPVPSKQVTAQSSPATKTPAHAPAATPPKEAPAPAKPGGIDLFGAWQTLVSGTPQEYRLQAKMTMGMNGETLLDQYFKGGKMRRLDGQSSGDGLNTNSRMFFLQNGGTVFCSTREGTETCFKVAPQNDEQSPAQFDAKAYAPKPEDYQLGNFTLAPLPPRMVAGESTICYKVTYAKEKVSEMSACYTPDGIAMYLEMTGPESSIHFEAQRLERRVNDADLVPPPAQSMEDLYKGISN